MKNVDTFLPYQTASGNVPFSLEKPEEEDSTLMGTFPEVMTGARRLSSCTLAFAAIVVLGAGYLLYALGLVTFQVAVQGGSIWEVWFTATLLSLIGLGLWYGAFRLPRTNVSSDRYPTIAGWTLGIPLIMVLILVIYQVNPATMITEPARAPAMLLGLSNLAGYGMGINRARAIELELTSEELERTIGKLEASNERLDQFASVISHDMKQPLRTVTVNLELLERGTSLDDENRAILEDAVSGSKRLQEMIDAVLAYSRVEADPRTFEWVDCTAVCRNVLTDLDVLIDERNADVMIGDLPEVYGDREQLYQVFQNLIENAIKYSEAQPRVQIDATRLEDGYRISVSDEGIGIDPGETDAIFSLFERSARTEAADGVGLGLALCQQIIEQHGGSIWVESTLGEGSTFCIELDGARTNTAKSSRRPTAKYGAITRPK